MKRALDEIHSLVRETQALVLYAGDIFDSWKAPAEIVNWALKHLPEGYAIPGNHDLPMHQPELIHRSPFWTLVEAGKLKLLGSNPARFTPNSWGPSPFEFLDVYGFPFNGAVKPKRREGTLNVALTHEYLWVPGYEHYGASPEHRLGKRAKTLSPFHVVVVGDNHAAFTRTLKNGTKVVNCGSLLRRKSSEVDYRPRLGLIHASGAVSSHELDTSKDVITELVHDEEPEEDPELSEFIEELAEAQSSHLSFKDAMRQALLKAKARETVKTIVMEAME